MNAPMVMGVPLPAFVRREQVLELISQALEAETLRCSAIAQAWLNLAQTPAGRKVARGILRQIQDGHPGF